MRQPYKISFCTVSMNRLHHLKQTIPANLRDNASYPNVEFVLLDYNSSDGLEDWIKSDMKEFINSGKLVYYRTTEPQHFKRSHSRNMAFKLATGDIICNVDADNYTGKNFARYINRQFIANNNIFIIPDIRKIHYFIRDVFGRICCWKKDFDATGGFDEQLEGYGHEDVDFINRLIKLKREEVIIFNFNYLKAITHSDVERIQHEFILTNLKTLYISHLNPHSSRILFLFSDGTFSIGTVTDTIAEDSTIIPTLDHADPITRSLNGRYVLVENSWTSGVWQQHENTIQISTNNSINEVYRLEDNGLVSLPDGAVLPFVKITNQKVVIRAINVYSLIKNSTKVDENKNRDLVPTHTFQVGQGSVVKNFIDEISISA